MPWPRVPPNQCSYDQSRHPPCHAQAAVRTYTVVKFAPRCMHIIMPTHPPKHNHAHSDINPDILAHPHKLRGINWAPKSFLWSGWRESERLKHGGIRRLFPGKSDIGKFLQLVTSFWIRVLKIAALPRYPVWCLIQISLQFVPNRVIALVSLRLCVLVCLYVWCCWCLGCAWSIYCIMVYYYVLHIVHDWCIHLFIIHLTIHWYNSGYKLRILILVSTICMLLQVNMILHVGSFDFLGERPFLYYYAWMPPCPMSLPEVLMRAAEN